MPSLPGTGGLSARPLQFIWVVDCSSSMNQQGKIQSLNTAIRESIKPMRSTADDNPFAEILVRALKFASGASWHIAQPTPVDAFEWIDVTADGVTDMGQALKILAEELKVERMPERGLPPVLVLVSDGMPSDNFEAGLKVLLDEPWGKRAVRMAIAIGEDSDHEILQKFIANKEIPVLQANNPESLVKYIRFVSTAVLQAASAPPSKTTDDSSSGGNVPIPQPPPPDGSDLQVVW